MKTPTLLSHLRELADARLVTAVSAEAFEFRHALTREAVYATLLKRQRLIYHGLVADILEAQASGAAPAADLAYHYREAANWPKVLEYAQQAGEQAQNLYAPREAAQHFSTALEAASQLGQPPQLSVLRGRGQAYETLGEFEAARADYELGLSQARAAGVARAEWQALLDLGLLWAGRDYARTGEYYQQALALAQASGDPLAVAQSLNRLGNWLVNTGRLEPALQMHQEALNIFRAQASASGMAETHNLLSLNDVLSGDMPAAARHMQEAARLYRQTGDKHGLAAILDAHSGLVLMNDVLPVAAQNRSVSRQEAAESAGLAREIGWLAGLAEVQWMFGLSLANFGAFGEALVSAGQALKTASDIDHRQWIAAAHLALAQTYRLLLEPETAIHHLQITRAMADELGSAWWIGYSGAFLALAHLQLGQAPAARQALQSAAAALGLETEWPARSPATLMARYLLWAWAETDLAIGQPEPALAIAVRLLDTAINPAGTPIPHLLKLQGEALLALGRLDEAERALSLAAQGARDQESQAILWPIEAARARLAKLQGRPAEAQRAGKAARAVIETLANSLDSPAGQAFRGRALGQLSADELLAA